MRVVVIIPAYNEERTVGNVAKAALLCPLVHEVVVVSDGSSDNTVASAREAGARVVELPVNRGKGGAMKAGLEGIVADAVLFLDADLVGFSAEHVEAMLKPLLHGETEVSVGVFGNGRLTTDLAQKIAPFLSGQRAISWRLLSNLPDFSETGWGVEIALTRYIKEQDINIVEVPLYDVTQIMKEEKVGLLKGFSSRMKMYWEIVKAISQVDSAERQ
jgi:glycosyltransferase involved in cell wall biosynthesis